MDDREAVAAIVAGDPAGLADAYDRYATSLYGYCRTMLTPDDAADAVQDTFVIAAARVSALRDPRKLRPWLYAVARNECLRRLRPKEAPSEIPDVADDSAPEPHLTAQQHELRELVQDAIAGLNQPDREVIELNLRHELDGAELAAVLGVSRGHAHAIASRARGQLERSLGALLVARTGQPSCAELSRMLAGWNGELTVLLRKRLSRHIENCDVCGERKRRALAPAMMYGLAPMPLLPAGHRRQTLMLCSDGSAEAMDFKQYVIRQSGAFGPSGFPRPQRRGGRGGGRRGGGRRGEPGAALIAAASVAAAAAVIIAMIALRGNGPVQTLARSSSTSTPSSTSGPEPQVTAATLSPTPPASTPGAAPAVVPPATSASPRPSKSARPSTSPKPSPSPSRSPSHSPTPSPSASPSPSPSLSPTPSPSPFWTRTPTPSPTTQPPPN